MGLFSIGKVKTLLAETEKQLAKISSLHDHGGGKLIIQHSINELRQLTAKLSYQLADSTMANIAVYTFLGSKCRGVEVVMFLKKQLKKWRILSMGWFSVSEDDAIQEIEKINAGMRVIRETIRITGDEVVNSNKVEVAVQLQECINHYKKYENIVSRLGSMERTLFYGASVPVWNGETVSPLQWEQYFKNIVHMFTNRFRTLG